VALILEAAASPNYAGRVTTRERNLLNRRLAELDAKLRGLYELRVVIGDPDLIEKSLLAEQYEIQFQLGDEWIEREGSA
jgi:hypothetical protein